MASNLLLVTINRPKKYSVITPLPTAHFYMLISCCVVHLSALKLVFYVTNHHEYLECNLEFR